jgi:hypothetical protein
MPGVGIAEQHGAARVDGRNPGIRLSHPMHPHPLRIPAPGEVAWSSRHHGELAALGHRDRDRLRHVDSGALPGVRKSHLHRRAVPRSGARLSARVEGLARRAGEHVIFAISEPQQQACAEQGRQRVNGTGQSPGRGDHPDATERPVAQQTRHEIGQFGCVIRRAPGEHEVEIVDQQHLATLQSGGVGEHRPEAHCIVGCPARGVARACGDRGKGRRRARTRRAEHEHVPVTRFDRRDRLPLLRGQVEQAERDAVGGRERVVADHSRQRIAPRPHRRPRRRGPADALHVGTGRERQLHGAAAAGPVDDDGTSPRVSRQASRRIIPHEAEAVGPVGDPQRDAHRDVGEHGVAHDTRRALGAEHEMHAQRPTARREIGEQRVQFGALGDECGELVDDHDEAGEVARGQFVDGPRPRLRESELAPTDLCPQRFDRPAGEHGVEVAQSAQHVRQPGERSEGRPTLEVHEHERHLVGRTSGGHAQHPRDQQLTFARAGGSGHDSVGAVRDEVDDRDPVGCDTEGRTQPRPLAAERQQLAEFDPIRDAGGSGPQAGRPRRVGQPPRRVFRRRPGDRVASASVDPAQAGLRAGAGPGSRGLCPRDHRLPVVAHEPVAAARSDEGVVRQPFRPLLARRNVARRRFRREARSHSQCQCAGDGGGEHRRSVDLDPGVEHAQQRGTRNRRSLHAQ